MRADTVSTAWPILGTWASRSSASSSSPSRRRDELGPASPLRQGYLAGEGDVEVARAHRPGRGVDHRQGRSAVSPGPRSQVPVDVDEAEDLWPHTAGRRLEKVRHRVPVPGGVAEVDRYERRPGRPVDGRGGVRRRSRRPLTSAAAVVRHGGHRRRRLEQRRAGPPRPTRWRTLSKCCADPQSPLSLRRR